MRLSQTVRIGNSLLIGLNLLMALGCVWIFTRMAPAIEQIIERNERSLQSCEEMLAVLALQGGSGYDTHELLQRFNDARSRAETNVTEPDEPAQLAIIAASSAMAFEGDPDARTDTVQAITRLGRINRDAMALADNRAQQLGRAGAWGVVFMASCAFLVGMVFLRVMTVRVVLPFEELYATLAEYREGNSLRRCSGAQFSREIKTVFNGINDLLDTCCRKPVEDAGAAPESPQNADWTP